MTTDKPGAFPRGYANLGHELPGVNTVAGKKPRELRCVDCSRLEAISSLEAISKGGTDIPVCPNEQAEMPVPPDLKTEASGRCPTAKHASDSGSFHARTKRAVDPHPQLSILPGNSIKPILRLLRPFAANDPTTYFIFWNAGFSTNSQSPPLFQGPRLSSPDSPEPVESLKYWLTH